MRRRTRLAKQWTEYETERRKLGQCGQSGLLFALSLVSPLPNSYRNKQSYATIRTATATKTISGPTTKMALTNGRADFITEDALIELPRLNAKSVHCIVTSPPYWPTKRAYSGRGIGFQKTLDEYVGNLVTVFRQARKVLRDDGILWVVIDDSYSRAGGVWHGDPKSPALRGLAHQGTTNIRDAGNLLLIPARFALAMQDDGWMLRAEIIWAKTNLRPESVIDRPTKDFEKVLMFVKQRRYIYDSDPIRVPLVKASTIPGRKKPGMNRGDGGRTERVCSNPLGRNSGSVWTIAFVWLSWRPCRHDARGTGETMLARVQTHKIHQTMVATR
jgi:DNA methylase